MQEIRHDGSEKITENAGLEDIYKAMSDPKNKTILIHKAGSVIKTKEGKEFTVGNDGKLHPHPAVK